MAVGDGSCTWQFAGVQEHYKKGISAAEASEEANREKAKQFVADELEKKRQEAMELEAKGLTRGADGEIRRIGPGEGGGGAPKKEAALTEFKGWLQK